MVAQSPVPVGMDLKQGGLRKLAREVALEQRLVGGDRRRENVPAESTVMRGPRGGTALRMF